MANVTVLGAGMVGRAMAIDLAGKHTVTSVDLSEDNLAQLKSFGITTKQTDLSIPNKIKEIVADADLVIGAVPGFMGYEMIKAVINARKNIVDISFFPEDPLILDDMAKEAGVTAVVDCGVAPGMDNIFLGYHHERMEVENFVCMVGGLPKIRTMPYQYKAPFSPVDVLEEYTRPARLVENGFVVTKPALTEPEFIDFDEIGTLEAFNTDGLRTIIKTIPVKNMKEKTLRYPGHRTMMETLRDTGLFSSDEIELKGQKIRPVDVASKLLFPRWKYEKGEEEFTVMRIIIEGTEKGVKKKYTYDLLDWYDSKTQTSSMERTTGYTCTAVANLVLEKLYTQKGIIPPEYLGKDEKCFQFVLNYLKSRGVNYKATVS